MAIKKRLKKPTLPVTFNAKEQKFYKGGRVVSKKSRQYKNYVIDYVCGQVAQGKSLEDILPVEAGGTLPNIMEFITRVDSNEEYKKIYNKAKRARFILISERLVSTVQDYQQDPSPEKAELLKAINNARTYLERGMADHESILIEVHSVVPKNFWTRTKWEIGKTKEVGNETEKE